MQILVILILNRWVVSYLDHFDQTIGSR